MPNRLESATSPYLLQHQDNPVDWWEWSDGAFEEARRRDIPILVSVGYAACHWCHVMAHESFEDQVTAKMLNESFVNIKVDREERPDIDSIYMEAVQAMSGHGGWPMTVWVDHDGKPFYGGTYYPRTPRHGMPSFQQVIRAVSTAWQDRRDDLAEQATRLTEAIDREIPRGDTPGQEVLESAYESIASSFDNANGGFGSAPKFPQQPVLEFLLRARERPWAPDASAMLSRALEKMAAGGIHDQLGGGFARYSVDGEWLVPHFEKMLYDNAQLARLYLWAGIELDRTDFVSVARSTLDYMWTDLRHPNGGFFSSEDADSEGVEGSFYVWTAQEIRSVLGVDADALMAFYGVTDRGNFEGSNVLHIVGGPAPRDLDASRRALLEARAMRVRPGLDDKIISSWNGLAIRAYAEAGAVLDDARYLETAERAASFAMEHLLVEGRLMRSWRAGMVSVPGYLDDAASMAVALFTLYSATGELRWYAAAMNQVAMLDAFEREDGGFYQTSVDGPRLIKRPIDLTDNPLPSGNALAAEALLLAAALSGEDRFRDRAESALEAAGALAGRHPSMVAHHLAVALSSHDMRELAIVGDEWRDLAEVYWRSYRPNVVLAGSPGPNDAVPLLVGRSPERTTAFVCRGFVCDMPTSDATVLESQLGP